MNKKGFLFDIIIWIIVGFVTLLFFAIWMYGHNLVTEKLLEAGANSDTAMVNITAATQATFVQINDAMGGLRYMAFIIMVAMAMAILISNFLVKAHPVFFFAYMLVIIIAIIFSVYISNSYEDLMTEQTFGSTLSTFKAGSFIMLNLPLWTTIIGFLGAIFLFAGIYRGEEGGGII